MKFKVIQTNHIANSGNQSALLDCWMYFHLGRITSNTRLYFYKYNLKDVVEVLFDKDTITMFKFNEISPDDAEKSISDELGFYEGYFRSAGLFGKRFLFDVCLKLPVTYQDFDTYENLKEKITGRHSLFILDKKDGYVVTPKDVKIYEAIKSTSDLDNCLVAFANNLIGIKSPKHALTPKNLDTIMVMTLVSGFMSGISAKDVEEQASVLDTRQKFKYAIENMEFNDQNIDSIYRGLKTVKFDQIWSMLSDVGNLDKIDNEFDGNVISLSKIVQIGIDKFLKTIKHPDRKISVTIDLETDNIVYMYIRNGAAFLTPTRKVKNTKYFNELFDSENIYFVSN